ncbi:Tex-like protein N-terminal domain [Weissella viridescens]|uniref:Tex-like protein N-terminal domain n=1 Tax=Weissella viridescens TaxID=1629 RepID=A0A380NYE4_WEIVI|nr:Tex-like protein N-terminal domain [Weissella viridescens]
MDEVQIRDIQTIAKKFSDLVDRKTTVEKAIREQGAWNASIEKALAEADSMQKVEDIYLPYKQKRRTKATIAKEAGLMPMAQFIQTFPESGIEDKAQTFINHEQGIESVEDVLAGVHEIFAEVVGENAGLREWVRNYTQKNGKLTSKSSGVRRIRIRKKFMNFTMTLVHHYLKF